MTEISSQLLHNWNTFYSVFILRMSFAYSFFMLASKCARNWNKTKKYGKANGEWIRLKLKPRCPFFYIFLILICIQVPLANRIHVSLPNAESFCLTFCSQRGDPFSLALHTFLYYFMRNNWTLNSAKNTFISHQPLFTISFLHSIYSISTLLSTLPRKGIVNGMRLANSSPTRNSQQFPLFLYFVVVVRDMRCRLTMYTIALLYGRDEWNMEWSGGSCELELG